jgi:hypothetical protein
MSHTISAIKNKQQKPKVHLQQYLSDMGEPWDDITRDAPIGFETELLESNHHMKRRFRRLAREMRSQYS